MKQKIIITSEQSFILLTLGIIYLEWFYFAMAIVVALCSCYWRWKRIKESNSSNRIG